MQRDWTLIREIILQIYHCNNQMEDEVILVLPDVEEHKIAYHVKLLNDAGLIVADYRGGRYLSPLHLTWQGQEFAESCLNPSVWKSTMLRFSRAGANVTFHTLTECLKVSLLKQVGL